MGVFRPPGQARCWWRLRSLPARCPPLPALPRASGRPGHVFIRVSPQVKQKDNGVALKCFQRVIHSLDALGWEERQLALVKGLLAGNVFDWGAKAVSE